SRVGKKSRCEMYAFKQDDNGYVRILNETRLACSSWEYDLGDNIHTITNQYNLVCDRVWLRAASQSIFMFGVMVGSIIFSHISDWFGRKRAMLFMLPLPLVAGILQVFSPTYLVYNVGRFVTSVGIGGIHSTAFTLIMEVLSARHRALASLISSGGWTVGLVTLTPFAWFIRDWVHLQIFISLFFLINTAVWFFIPESPRWLLATRRYEKAGSVLKNAIKKNKITNVDLHGVIKDYEDRIEQEKMTTKPTFMALFRYSCIRRTTLIKSAMSPLVATAELCYLCQIWRFVRKCSEHGAVIRVVSYTNPDTGYGIHEHGFKSGGHLGPIYKGTGYNCGPLGTQGCRLHCLRRHRRDGIVTA
ncbi:organic anion transporter, putative, partial [Ixodes scapularis]